MATEIKNAIVEKRPTDPVSLCVVTEDDNDYFILDTGVDRCNLNDGQVVQVTMSDEAISTIDGKSFIHPDLEAKGVWGEPCAFCKYNPYLGKSAKQCDVCYSSSGTLKK